MYNSLFLWQPPYWDADPGVWSEKKACLFLWWRYGKYWVKLPAHSRLQNIAGYMIQTPHTIWVPQSMQSYMTNPSILQCRNFEAVTVLYFKPEERICKTLWITCSIFTTSKFLQSVYHYMHKRCAQYNPKVYSFSLWGLHSKVHATKKYERVEVYLHSLLTLTLEVNDTLYLRGKTRDTHWKEGWIRSTTGLEALEKRKMSHSRNRINFWVTQPIA